MSWIKRRGQATNPNPSPVPPVQMYNPNQHSNLQPQWQQQDLQPPTDNWYNQPQANQQKTYTSSNYSQPPQHTNYWQQPIQQTEQSYNQNAANQYNQQFSQYGQGQTGYFENPTYHQGYNNQQQQNPVYGLGTTTMNHVEQQQQQQQPQSDGDVWNWSWGDENNSNVQNLPAVNTNSNTSVSANAIAESFGGTESWNWSVEDSNVNATGANQAESHGNLSKQENVFSKVGKSSERHNKSPNHLQNDDHRTNFSSLNLNDAPPINQLAVSTNPKSKSDNLTPQWSTESQMSQDSSDLLHTSESDKSHMLSRSSTVSESPTSGGQEASNDTFIPSRTQHFEAYNSQVIPEIPTENAAMGSYYKQDNLQHVNKEVLPSVNEEVKLPKTNPTPPPPPKVNPTPPPVMKNNTPPLMPPPLSSSVDESVNPYKRTGGLSVNAANKYKNENRLQQSFFAPPANYPHNSSPFSQSVNLETLPDNSEQPDSLPQPTQLRKISTGKTLVHQWAENNEVAPINDRNQYLETGQLSNSDYNHSVMESSDTLPPPSFPRMVLGQIEQVDSNSVSHDGPPPGLSRMVLGQTGNPLARSDPTEGLHRMIPGESSSPEVYPSTTYQPSGYTEHDASESENQPVTTQIRSATIGADNPPHAGNVSGGISINRSETIGADTPLPYNSTNRDNKKSNNHIRSASSNYNVRETNADGANNLDDTKSNPAVSNRRDSIEGQPQDDAINNLVSSVRDLTVGESINDGANSALALSDRNVRRSSRQESTDSEQDHDTRGKPPLKDRKDRRYHDKHEQYDREKSKRYSPDQYRDRKHDRRRYRDKRYDEESDYYSDKERDKKRDERDRRDDFDRKYNSLKRDKEKERKRREHRSHRDYGRDGRREYYGRYEDDYEEGSRASSRSDSMHNSYRQDRDRHRDRDRQRRHRDPFNPYMQGYSFDPYNSYYQQYQYHYYENLRRTNPQAYAEWYRKYYQQSGSQQGYGAEDRASVHSGRSSANDELAKDRYTRQSYYSQATLNYYRDPHTHSISGQYGLEESSRPFDQTDSSLYLDETTLASQRLTPAKYATAHIKASISSGHLVKIFPHYPLDGQNAVVEVSNLNELLSNDDEYKELLEFPGPLVKGVTHKKTIIEYCENKIRSAIYSRDIIDVDSYILMWELLILLLRQNGMVVGTDIAELLMKDRKQQNSRRVSVTSNSSSVIAEGAATTSEASNVPVSETNSSSTSILKEEIVTNKFREHLLYGSGKEALEWAMKHGLWGHALFLASKLDKRTYANVMTRFANGIAMNDPLQTLYQLLSGKVPAAVTCVADEKWGDWRPHLAMILSNTTQRPELDRRAITTLGDTLLNRGSLYAAQFCYLMAQVGFGRYGDDGIKLVLLGSNHSKPFLEFAINEAMHMTEVYEYACTLNDPDFLIPEFLSYKYLLATRLADRGFLEKALAYLEKISIAIVKNPSSAQASLIGQVCQLGDRLKYNDPVEEPYDGDVDLDVSRPDNSWLKDLKAIERDSNMGLITYQTEQLTTEVSQSDPLTTTETYGQQSNQEQTWQQQYSNEQQWQTPQYTSDQPQLDYQQNNQNQIQNAYGNDMYQEQQQPWSTQQQWGNIPSHTSDLNTLNQQTDILQPQNDYWNNAHAQQEEVEKQPDEEIPAPQISMPNQTKHVGFNDEEETSASLVSKQESPVKPKPQQTNKASTGFFGGVFSMFSLRPKNQMRLPDDKDPSIVWDEKNKMWINKDSDPNETVAELKPPPKMTELFPAKNTAPNIPYQNQSNPIQQHALNTIPMVPAATMQDTGNIPIAQGMQRATPLPTPTNMNNEDVTAQQKPPQPNMFKLQRGRSLKKSYVDVFNPGSKSSGNNNTLPAPDSFNSLPNATPQMNFFIPAPITDPNVPTNFLTPTPTQQPIDNHQQMPPH